MTSERRFSHHGGTSCLNELPRQVTRANDTHYPSCTAMSADLLERPRKRQRVTQACQRCRSKKFRCDGQAPSCGPCLAAQATCLYNATAGRQRGLQPGYVKALESLWGAVFRTIPGSEHAAAQLLAGLPVHAGHVVDEPGSDEASLLEIWRASSLPASIRILLDGGSLPTSSDAGVEDTTWSLPLPSDVGNAEQHNVDDPPAPASPTFAPLSSLAPAPEPSDLPDLPLDWQNLIQVYLCTEYCFLPIFEKSSLYRWAYSYQDQPDISLCDLESSSRGQYASLWAVLVLGELHIDGAGSTRIRQMKLAAKALLATAESLNPDRTYSPAYLLWALIHTGCRKYILAQMMLAQATVLSSLRNESVSATADDKRESLMQVGCFVVETILAFATGTQQSSITMDADFLNPSDVGEWDPFINFLDRGPDATALNVSIQLPPSRTGSTFQAWVRLMAILRKASHPLTSPGALSAELESWEASLPASLRGIATTPMSSTPVPPQLNVKLWYVVTSTAISQLRQGITSATSLKDLQDLPLLHLVKVLDTMERQHGLRMLPASMGVFVARAIEPTLTNTSPVLTGFPGHWGWRNAPTGLDTNIHFPTHQAVDTGSRTSVVTNCAATLGYHSPEQRRLHNATDTILGAESLQAKIRNDDLTYTQVQFQQRNDDCLPTPVNDPAIVEGVNLFSEPSTSHDLLDYFTMFEGNDRYVQRDWLGYFFSQSHGLIKFPVMIETTWKLSAFLAIRTTLHSRVVRFCCQ